MPVASLELSLVPIAAVTASSTVPSTTRWRPEVAVLQTDLSSADACRKPSLTSHGPGWFDSSWELQRGLDVREGSAVDQRLHAWIDGFLQMQPVR